MKANRTQDLAIAPDVARTYKNPILNLLPPMCSILILGGQPFGHGTLPFLMSQIPISLLINSLQEEFQKDGLLTLTRTSLSSPSSLKRISYQSFLKYLSLSFTLSLKPYPTPEG